MLPTGTDVVRTQVNRVPEPTGPDFVLMTVISRTRLATNQDSYQDGFPDGPEVKFALQETQVDIQLDIHGPASNDNVQIVSTLFRDEYSTSYFDACPFDIQALYTSEPRQIPFVNAESQWEDRWIIDLSLQANQVVQVAQDFFDKVALGLISVDVVYPP